MSKEDLDKAETLARVKDADRDAIEAISKTLGIKEEVVVRVLYANTCMGGEYGNGDVHGPPTQALVEDRIPKDAAIAIAEEIRMRKRRILLRKIIALNSFVYVAIEHLVKDPKEICVGCGYSIVCATRGVSTPEKCVANGPVTRWVDDEFWRDGRRVPVYPKRIKGEKVVVSCLRPKGEYVIDVRFVSNSRDDD